MRVVRSAGLLMMMGLAACGGASSAAEPASGQTIKLTHDAAVGARFGSAGPRACAPKTAPVKGAPSIEQITAYVICSREGEFANTLTLVNNVKVTAVSKGRPYDPKTIYASGAVDVTKSIYDIRGSVDSYSCNPVGTASQIASGFGTRPGTQCVLYHERNAEGSCYVTTLGEWACTMVDRNHTQMDEQGIAPPA